MRPALALVARSTLLIVDLLWRSPRWTMSDWMATLAAVNPVSYAIERSSAACSGPPPWATRSRPSPQRPGCGLWPPCGRATCAAPARSPDRPGCCASSGAMTTRSLMVCACYHRAEVTHPSPA